MDKKQRVFVWLAALFVAALVTGDFVGGKFFLLFGRNFSAGIIPFPLTFVLTDLVNEFYGTHGARRLTFVGLGAAVFVWAIITLSLHLPASPDSPIPGEVFQAAFGTSARLYVASLTAYVPKYVMVPSAVALFSSAVPCQRALLAYRGRSERMTVMMYRPPASKKAIPVGFAPNCCNLAPSAFFCSHETTVHVPMSCSLSACCWLTAPVASKGSPNAVTTQMPMMPR